MEQTAEALTRPVTSLNSRRINILSGLLLVIVYGTFAYSHVLSYLRTHEWSLLLFCLSETLTVAFILVRTEPKTVSEIPTDWLVAVAGTFAPLLLRPAPWSVAPAGRYVLVAGILLQIAGLLSLNRSIAVVAAKREIKTAGMYRFVRHPLYASYLLMYSGYLMVNSTGGNLTIYLATLALLGIRMSREERHLAQDPRYREYMERVTSRIIPFVY